MKIVFAKLFEDSNSGVELILRVDDVISDCGTVVKFDLNDIFVEFARIVICVGAVLVVSVVFKFLSKLFELLLKVEFNDFE